MDDYIWLNGALIPVREARISPFDRGFLYGDGLFETMRSYGGGVHLLRRHLVRLASGAALLGITLPEEGELVAAIHATIAANGFSDAAVRLTVTRGIGGTLFDTEAAGVPTILITCRPLLQSMSTATTGERVITLRSVHRPPEGPVRIKSLNYLTAVLSAPELKSAGVREGLLLTDDGCVARGTVSNVFCVIGGGLRTAPLELGVLAGITRARVLELAHGEGIACAERRFGLADLLGAEECFYTNSLRELVPVIAVDDMPIGDGTPGPLTLALLRAYRAEAPDEHL